MARRKRGLFKLKLKKETIYSIFSLGIFAVAILIPISAFFPRGALLKLDSLFDLYFGWGRIPFSVFLIQFGLAMSKVKLGLTKANSIIGVFFIFLALLGLSQAGIVGLLLFKTIYTFIPLGFVVFLTLLLLAVFGATVLFNISFGEVVKMLADAVKVINEFFKKYF